jgi:cytochrome c oxidase assembly protein subunit 11
MSDAPHSEPLSSADRASDLRKANRRLTLQLAVFAVGALGFGFALVPLYDKLCEITGYGSRTTLTQAAVLDGKATIGREVTVEFISTAPTVGEWEFRPLAVSAKVRTGELSEAKFIAKNLSAQPAIGQAIPDIAPRHVSKYFQKTECFCFTPQSFAAEQEREFTVRFVVNSELPNDVDRITLGYAMYGLPQTKVAAVR